MNNFYANYPVEGGGGVTSLNGLTGALTLVAGSGITITPAGSDITIAAVNSGTVTSVGLALPISVFTVSGSPVTTSGTLTGSFMTQAANTVFAGPSSGAAATPTFRALTSSDVPVVNAINQLTGDITAGPVTGSTSAVASLVATSNATLTTLSSLTTAGSLATVGTISTGVWQATEVAIAYGGTGVGSVTTTPTASAWAGWNANKQLQASSFIPLFTTTVTSATPVALLNSSNEVQQFTGSTAQVVTLPATGTFTNPGVSYTILNNSSATVTVESSGGNTLQVMAAGSSLVATLNMTSGTTAASWNWVYTTAGGPGGAITALTGDVTAAGPGSAAASLVATTNATLTTLSALTTAGSLATVGTIGTGVWQGSVISALYGGTGNGTWTAQYVPFAASTTAFAEDIQFQWNSTNHQLLLGASTTGIGTLNINTTTSSYYGIDVQTTGAVPLVLQTQGANIITQTYQHANSATNPNQHNMNFSRGTIASPTAHNSGDLLGRIQFNGYGSAQFSTGNSSIDCKSTQAGTTGNQGGQLIFNTTPNASSTLTQALLLDQNQNASFANVVNIGTAASVAGTLTLASSTASTGLITLSNGGATSGNAYTFAFPTTVGTSGYALTSSGVSGTANTWSSVLTNPMTTGGDLIYGGSSGTPTRLANGSAGQVLESAGSTSAPVWTTLTAPTVQVFTSGSGSTYTTPTGAKWLKITCVGGGGGGGGTASTSSSSGAGGGGGGGATVINWIANPAGTYTYTVGTGGAGGTSGNNSGTSGNATTFSGGTLSAGGGTGGGGSAAITSFPVLSTGTAAGGSGTGGNIRISGGIGAMGLALAVGQVIGGSGGSTAFGPTTTGGGGTATGIGAGSYGCGGAGGTQVNNGGNQAGGPASNGVIIVEEFYQ